MTTISIPDAVWEPLAELGYVDDRGGAEYQRLLADNPQNRRAFQIAGVRFMDRLSGLES